MCMFFTDYTVNTFSLGYVVERQKNVQFFEGIVSQDFRGLLTILLDRL